MPPLPPLPTPPLAQPRILGAAQERLTHAISDVYDRTNGWAQQWARLMLTTVGRGGNAQVRACRPRVGAGGAQCTSARWHAMCTFV